MRGAQQTPPGGAPDDGGLELLVATYNVHGCVGSDGVRDAGRVARVLQSLGAGIVGLQEVDSRPGPGTESAQMDFLASTTGYRAVPGHTIECSDRLYGNVLLTRWPVRSVRQIDLSQRGREPRGAIDATLDLCGQDLRVLVTHFGLRATERRRQVRKLLTAVAAGPDGPTLILGDLNEWWPFGVVRRSLHRHFERSRVLRSFPASRPVLALDRIYARSPALLAGSWTVRTHQTRHASDHLPVVGRLLLR